MKKMGKSIFLTLVCAAAILAVGYAGIIFIGEKVLKSPQEPELITMTGNISNLFYSELEDDIQLYPWNYYPQEDTGDGQWDDAEAGRQEVKQDLELFIDYSPYLENNVFYTLIAVAADVDPQEVSRWYDEQEKTITTSMKRGKNQDGEAVEWYFYEDVIRLNGKEYQVKIACDSWSITSFSCIQCRNEGIKETEAWNENKERFMKWMEENQGSMQDIFNGIYGTYYSVGEVETWYMYVELYQDYLDQIHYDMLLTENFGTDRQEEKEEERKKEEEKKTAQVMTDGVVSNSDWEKTPEAYGMVNDVVAENAIQMIELKDSFLLVMEGEITVGLYYDVVEQRITGFHFFYK